MLKKRLYLGCFLASFVDIYITAAFETFANYSPNFWMTASKFFTVEPAFCKRDKNHKFEKFKIIPC